MVGVNSRNMQSCLQKCNKLNKSHLIGQLLNLFLTYILIYFFFRSFSAENSLLNFVQAFRYTLCIVSHIVDCTITHAILSTSLQSRTYRKQVHGAGNLLYYRQSLRHSNNSLYFVEIECFLPCLQQHSPLLYLGPDESLPPFSFKANFSIILPNTPRISKSCAAFRFSDQYITGTLHGILLCRSASSLG